MGHHTTREVMVPIIATDKHCNNDCASMSHNAKWCNYFNDDLIWDSRLRSNGNIRLNACKSAEAKAQVINLAAKNSGGMP